MAASALGADSVAYQVNPQHTGAQDADSLTPPLGIRWGWNLGGPTSYPVIAGGKVFVTSRDLSNPSYGTTLYAFDQQTGTLAWSRSITGAYWWATSTYEAGKLFVLNEDGVLRAFDASNGAALWGKQMPGQYAFTGPPTAYNGVVYLGGAGSGGAGLAPGGGGGARPWGGAGVEGGGSPPAGGARG